MSQYVIIVPKQDELMAVEWAFQTKFGRPNERTRSGVELYRRDLSFGEVTFALLDKQTNTYSSILTADIIGRETPRLIFLVGTAMGRPSRTPIGSVLVSDGVIDISEKRYADDGRGTYVVRGPTKSDELTLDAKDFISRTFSEARARQYLRLVAKRPALVRGGARRADSFIETFSPTVLCEAIVSGNEYHMGTRGQESDELWSHAPTAGAYDMEAAGFALAASNNDIPWLVVRGISDHGTPETKSDYHRAVAVAVAGRFLHDFLQAGLVRAAELPLAREPATTIPHLRDEAYRLDGSWEGAMAYLDDDGHPVIFSESAEFTQEGSNVQGIVRSQRIQGAPRHDELEYRVSFSIARHGFAGGIWSETVAARKYFGVILGQFDNDSTILAGTWLGTHRDGVRRGFFKWHNVHRDGHRSEQMFDLGAVSNDLIGSFTSDVTRGYNDACRVTS